MALLARSVEPVIRWYLRIVPATSYKMKKLDALQRHMVSIILQVFRYPQETWKSFCSRRSRAATSFIKQHGQWWSHGWVVGSLKWLQHLERDFERQLASFQPATSPSPHARLSSSPVAPLRTCYNFTARLLRFKPASWVQRRRTVQLCGARVTSRTGTRRAGLGKVQDRWEEATLYSKTLMGAF